MSALSYRLFLPLGMKNLYFLVVSERIPVYFSFSTLIDRLATNDPQQTTRIFRVCTTKSPLHHMHRYRRILYSPPVRGDQGIRASGILECALPRPDRSRDMSKPGAIKYG